MKNGILQNKNCFITGATGGLGRNIALKLAENGCNLFLTSTKTTELQGLVEEIQSLRSELKVAYEPGDLNKIEDIENIIVKTREIFGSIDILMNCAGLFPVLSLADSQYVDFESCFNVNIRAPFLFCQEFHQDMVQNKWGRIVNIGSSSAYVGFKNTSIYCASKHALLGFSRALHDELKEHNVRSFCISPGSMKTEMGRLVKGHNYETFIEPREVADYIIFVISFDAEMATEEIRLNRVTLE